MLAPAPQILCGLGEEGGEPIFSTSSWLQVPTASPHLHSLTYKVPQADEGGRASRHAYPGNVAIGCDIGHNVWHEKQKENHDLSAGRAEARHRARRRLRWPVGSGRHSRGA